MTIVKLLFLERALESKQLIEDIFSKRSLDAAQRNQGFHSPKQVVASTPPNLELVQFSPI